MTYVTNAFRLFDVDQCAFTIVAFAVICDNGHSLPALAFVFAWLSFLLVACGAIRYIGSIRYTWIPLFGLVRVVFPVLDQCVFP
jgi:hypothetical protein